MDERRFERWTRTMAGAASRRGVVRGAAMAVVATFIRRAAGTDAAAATCAANGKPCDPANPGGCCSGACGKIGGRHRCKPARGAMGCTVLHNGCIEGMGGSCPGTARAVCIIRDSGKPYCALSAVVLLLRRRRRLRPGVQDQRWRLRHELSDLPSGAFDQRLHVPEADPDGGERPDRSVTIDRRRRRSAAEAIVPSSKRAPVAPPAEFRRRPCKRR